MDNPESKTDVSPSKTTYLNDEWEVFKEKTFIRVYNTNK